MAPGQGLAVAAIADTVLDAVADHFTAARFDLPGRRLIAPGTSRMIAWDTEQLVVTLTGIGVGQAAGVNAAAQRAGNPLSGAGMRHAVLAVQLVLCVPESVDGEKPPPARDVTAAGHRFLAAAGLLSQALVEACTRVRALTDPAGSGFAGLVTAGAVETLGPTGGMAAVEGTIQVTAGGLA